MNISRGILYNIEPIGIDSGEVESMTSYIIRISEKHTVHIRDLVNKLLIPKLEKHYLQRSVIYGGNSFFEGAKTINGYTSNSRDIVEALTDLTGRKDLNNLSLTGLDKVFATRELLKPNLSWCPYCIKESFIENNEVYYPLIWFVKAVKICGIHQCLLSDRCPTCLNNNQILRRKMILGYCSYCACRLDVNINLNKNIREEYIEWYNYIYQNVSSIIKGKNFFISIIKNKEQIIIHQLNIINEQCFDNELGNFAEFVGMPKNTLRAWLKGDNIPSLEGILQICFKLNITFANLLLDLNLKNNMSYASNRVTTNNSAASRNYIPIDFKLVEQKLNNILAADIPISMSEAAKKIGRDKRVLYSNFPDLCKRISSEFSAYEQKKRLERNLKMKIEIQNAVTFLVSVGINPSRIEVERKLNKSSLLRNPELNACWKELTKNIDI